jgi:hypothetical protein
MKEFLRPIVKLKGCPLAKLTHKETPWWERGVLAGPGGVGTQPGLGTYRRMYTPPGPVGRRFGLGK